MYKRQDGDWVKAKGTTLGADNGLGVAAIMAVLEAKDLKHGPLEALITKDEETGMYGAFGLKPGTVNGEILLNLDSEDEGELYIGCAGGMDVTAGRYNAFFADGNIYDNRADGVEVSYGDKIKIIGAAGKATDDLDKLGVSGTTGGSYAGGAVVADFGKFNASAGYYNFKDILAKNSKLDNAIWFVGAGTEFGDFALNAMYLKGDMSYHDVDLDGLDDDGWTVGLTFKGAEAAKKGSWGLFANYYDLGGQTYIAHTTDANTFDGQGFKGYGVGANYTVAKNMVLTAAYYDTKSKFDTSDKDKIMWTDLTITF